MHGNPKKGLCDNLPFQTMVGFFLQIYSRGGFQMNQHFLIMGWHGFHVTIQTLEQTT
jgi:hypothetical protein